jgi:trans-aconitate methyltransferase
MVTTECIKVYDSLSPAYHRAFEAFLAHTDQKVTARNWLRGMVDSLPSRRIFIDAGAGNGKVTAWFLPDFQRTIAIELNPTLCDDLRRICPTAEVIPQTIPEAQITVAADLVLCSHVLYYINEAEWMAHLESLASWLSPKGVLAVVVQNHDSDCMRMLGQFFNYRFFRETRQPV